MADITISPTKLIPADQSAEQGGNEKVSQEEKTQQKVKAVKEKLTYKQKIIKKNGKGKYNLTIPTPYEF